MLALDLSVWRDRGGSSAWRQMLSDRDAIPLVHMLRRCTYSERPFGDETFVQSVEQQTGRKWKRYNYDAELRAGGLALSLEALRANLDQAGDAASVGTERSVPDRTGTVGS
jgi:hypothetical protein